MLTQPRPPPLARDPWAFPRRQGLDELDLLAAVAPAKHVPPVHDLPPPSPPDPPEPDSPAYHYVPSPADLDTPSPDSMYTDRFAPSPRHPYRRDDRDDDRYPASPASPDHPRPAFFPAPLSAPHSQQLFPAPAVLDYPTLDRRMSEPVLGARASFAAAGPSPFSYDPSPAAVLPSPLSPRPSSSSFSSYSYGAPAGWPLKPEDDPAPPPLSPPYAGSLSSDSAHAPSPPRGPPRKPQAGAQHAAPPQGAPPASSAGPRPGSSKTYSFVALPGSSVKKRPRRRYDEIERLYQCSWPNCSKAYGTLNHLNAHVTMQKHGAKRAPGEFKELRKQWRQQKKDAEDADREREAHALAALRAPYAPHGAPAHELETLTSRHARRRPSLSPYPDPHGFAYLGGAYEEVRYVHPSAHHPQAFERVQSLAEMYAASASGEMVYQQQHQQQRRQGEWAGAAGVMGIGATRALQPYHAPPQQQQQQQQHPGQQQQQQQQQHAGQQFAQGQAQAYALGQNRLPENSTLLTPLPSQDYGVAYAQGHPHQQQQHSHQQHPHPHQQQQHPHPHQQQHPQQHPHQGEMYRREFD